MYKHIIFRGTGLLHLSPTRDASPPLEVAFCDSVCWYSLVLAFFGQRVCGVPPPMIEFVDFVCTLHFLPALR